MGRPCFPACVFYPNSGQNFKDWLIFILSTRHGTQGRVHTEQVSVPLQNHTSLALSETRVPDAGMIFVFPSSTNLVILHPDHCPPPTPPPVTESFSPLLFSSVKATVLTVPFSSSFRPSGCEVKTQQGPGAELTMSGPKLDPKPENQAAKPPQWATSFGRWKPEFETSLVPGSGGACL